MAPSTKLLPFTMGSLAEDVLPVYSTQKHLPLPTASPRRRRLTISTFTLVSLFYLVYWARCLFVQRPLPHVPLPLEIDPHPTAALSPLGLEAERVYHLGTVSLPAYRASLESFVAAAVPSPLKPRLTSLLYRFLEFDSVEPLPERPKIVWQTNDIHLQNQETQSWQETNQDYEYRFLDDDDAEEWVHSNFKGSAIEWTWNNLPHAVMKADFLRYLLLLVEGGTYSDIDTTCLKPTNQWGSDADVKKQPKSGSPPSAVVGVEADVGDRADWHDWWSRPLQIVQWTMSFAPGHPVLLDTVQRIYTNTLEAERRLRLDPVLDAGTILVKNLTVLEWTGPAVFTDATLRFLHIESGLKWVDLRGLQKPLRAGSVTVLPVTGFSPGVGNFGAKSKTDIQAMVQHDFKGSWKPKRPPSR